MITRISAGDRIFLWIAYIAVGLIAITTLYPMIYVISCSISDPNLVVQGKVWLYPKGLSMFAYQRVMENKDLWASYLNTVWYVVVGTLIGMVMVMITAYPLTRKHLKGRNFIMLFFAITMFFHGGLIPTYIVVKTLGMVDTKWALVIPGALATYNIIMVRTFMSTIPEELHEASKIDGAGEWSIFVRIILPLSKPIMAYMVLLYAVGQWNSYFSALIYLNHRTFYPLQMILREILIQLEVTDAVIDQQVGMANMEAVTLTVRFATIVVATLPILCIYPFLQKYFVKGVMVGSIKA